MTTSTVGSRTPVRARPVGQGGFTLIESLVALALLGIAFFGIAAGLLTTMRASAANDGRVSADTALVAVTEAMKSAPYRGTCDALPVLRSDWTGDRTLADGRTYRVQVDRVRYWNPVLGAFATRPCPFASGAKDTGAQLIDLTVTVVETEDAASGQVVVRNPAAKP